MTRRGECNHCGWCCQYTGQTTAVVSLSPESDVAFYRVRGFLVTHQEGQPVEARARVHMALPCVQHVEQRCAVYEDRPRTCREFPTAPAQIVGTPCSYTFEED